MIYLQQEKGGDEREKDRSVFLTRDYYSRDVFMLSIARPN
jgi:hypothetical protein